MLSFGVTILLAAYGYLNYSQVWIAICCSVFLALITICISYFEIRKKLTNRQVPVMDSIHNRQNVSEQNAKFSRTLFIVIAVSLGCWLPGILAYSIRSLCLSCVPLSLLHVCTALRLVNSLVNPIIYCFRIPIFRKTLKRMKVRKHSKQYTVNYSLWNKSVTETSSSLFKICCFGIKIYGQYTNMRTIQKSYECPNLYFLELYTETYVLSISNKAKDEISWGYHMIYSSQSTILLICEI